MSDLRPADDQPVTAVGFYYHGPVDDLHQFRIPLIRHLHSEFIGHPAADRWRMIFSRTVDGIETLVLIPMTAVTSEATEHLAAIMAHHKMRPLTQPELVAAVERMKTRYNIEFRGDSPQLARTAAQWWSDRFSERRAPKKTGVSAIDAAAAVIPRDRPSTQQVEAFRETLRSAINDQLESEGSSYVSMDYDPDRALSGALEAAGIHRGQGVIYLPWKTTTSIQNGRFTATGG
ncbi:hypothetical protein [Mycobacteroides abscessus]|uniref:hypothetical protein n=1 Tax=Mycobacteroides abscessus TaxID=36809 RepID=UPI0009A76EAA|nr:hypothetical protein [Mycobacteroides abscessus]SLH41402.1 Uncharacterised protein [Mycobacteroides abscessus subsp. massiliense]